jgi:hypothetical protein
MRRLQTFLILSIASVGLFAISLPVLAGGQNGQGCNQQGNNQGQSCPGTPALPEAHFAILLPLVVIAIVGAVLCVAYLRQHVRSHAEI